MLDLLPEITERQLASCDTSAAAALGPVQTVCEDFLSLGSVLGGYIFLEYNPLKF